jgi:diguanylate cyclase (GGDEF)-like protein
MSTAEQKSGQARDSRRLTRIIGSAIALAGAVLVAIIAYTGWNSNVSEAAAERARVENALNQAISRTLDQQKSVAWWDDAVKFATHTIDLDFTDANFGIFLTETYGHDEVYILDPQNRPVYAFLGGARQEPSVFYAHREPLAGVIAGLRDGSSGGLRDRPDDFGARQDNYDVLKGVMQFAAWKGNILLVDGKPSIVAAMTIVPNVELSVLSGTPYLLVSVVEIDERFVSDLGRSLLLPDLRNTRTPSSEDGHVSERVLADDGGFAGYLTWTTSRPGHVLLTVILPLVIIGVIGTGLLAAAMLRRLARASVELEQREARAVYQSLHDALSGLPNRQFFAERTEEALEVWHRTGAPRVLVGYLDIDRFKDINDTLGHHSGDQLVKAVATRLQNYLARGDFLARFGGDEFAVLRRHTDDSEAAPLETLAAAAFKRPFLIGGQEIVVTASVGLAQAPDHGPTVDALMKSADIALYEAKRRGRDQSVFFSAEMAAQLERRREIEVDLRESLRAGSLELHYQPILSTETNRITGVEALLRWNHPEKGAIPPGLFIPVAEEAGLMPALGEWVLKAAMESAARWPDLDVSINVSPAQIHHVDLQGLLGSLLRSTGVDPARITLEITEGVLLEDSARTRTTLAAIKRLGFKIALDDFGTGFSSLRYLIDFHFDKLKIDRSFVSGMSRVGSAKTVVKSVVDLGRALEMEVIAEGVENEAEAVLMRFLGCHSMQGYFFSRPVPAGEMPGLLASFNAEPAVERVSAAGLPLFRKQSY